MAISALVVTKTGDRSFSAAFTSAANTDVLTFAAIAAALPGVSSIETFIAAAPSLASFATRGVNISLISDAAAASAVQYDATGFTGFEAGDHVLRVSLAASVSA